MAYNLKGLETEEGSNITSYDMRGLEVDSPRIHTYTLDERVNIVQDTADKYGIDRNLFLRMGQAESGPNLDPNAVGPETPQTKKVGRAVGMFQFIPSTAKEYGITDRTDPVQSADAGARYFRDRLAARNGDTALALADYNYGPTRTDEVLAGRGQFPKETIHYVSKIAGVDLVNHVNNIQASAAPTYNTAGLDAEEDAPALSHEERRLAQRAQFTPEESAAKLSVEDRAVQVKQYETNLDNESKAELRLEAKSKGVPYEDVLIEAMETEEAVDEADRRGAQVQEGLKGIVRDPIKIAGALLSSKAKDLTPAQYESTLDDEDRLNIIIEAQSRGVAPQAIIEEETEAENIREREDRKAEAMRTVGQGLLKVADAEMLRADPSLNANMTFEEKIYRTAPQVAGQAILHVFTGGTVSGLFMASQIAGNTYQSLRDQGVGHDTALGYASTNGLIQGAMEKFSMGTGVLGNLATKIPGVKNIQNKIVQKIVNIVTAGGTEGLTEALQEVPDYMVNLLATNPDKSMLEGLDQLIKDPQFYLNMKESAAIGAIFGGGINAVSQAVTANAEERTNIQTSVTTEDLQRQMDDKVGGIRVDALGEKGTTTPKGQAQVTITDPESPANGTTINVPNGSSVQEMQELIAEKELEFTLMQQGTAKPEETYTQPIEGTVAPQIDRVNAVLNPIPSEKNSVRQQASAIKTKAVELLLDEFEPIRSVSEEAYKTKRAGSGYADVVESKWENHLFDWYEAGVRTPEDRKLIADYLVSNELLQNAERGIPTPNDITAEDATAKIAQIQSEWTNKHGSLDNFNKAIGTWTKMTDGILNEMEAEGFASEFDTKRILDSNDTYATIRYMENMPDRNESFAEMKKFSGLNRKADPIQQTVGVTGDVAIDNPLTATLEKHIRWERIKEYNQTVKALQTDSAVLSTRQNEKGNPIMRPIINDDKLFNEVMVVYNTGRINKDKVEEYWKTADRLDKEAKTAVGDRFNSLINQRDNFLKSYSFLREGDTSDVGMPITSEAVRKDKNLGTVTLHENGVRLEYAIPKNVADTINEEHPYISSMKRLLPDWAWSALNKPLGWFRRAVTTWNPGFFVDNFFRDGLLGYIAVDSHKWYRPDRVALSHLKALGLSTLAEFEDIHPIAKKFSKATRLQKLSNGSYNEYVQGGGGFGFVAQELWGKDWKKKLSTTKEKGVVKYTIMGPAKVLTFPLRKLAKTSERVTNVLETTVRLAAFMEAKRNTVNLKKKTGVSIAQKYLDKVGLDGNDAAKMERFIREGKTIYNLPSNKFREMAILYDRAQQMQHRDYIATGKQSTIDFARAGKLIKELNRVIPFLNAAVQASATYLRAMNPAQIKRKGGKAYANTVIKQGIVVAALYAFYRMLWEDDEQVEARKYLSERDKDEYLNYYLGMWEDKDGNPVPRFIRIRKGEPLKAFNTIERLMFGEDEEISNLVLQALEDLSPRDFIDPNTGDISAGKIISGLSPHFVKLGMELFTNENFYFGNPIYSEAQARNSLPYEVKGMNTPEEYVKLSKLMYENLGLEINPKEIQHFASGVAGVYGKKAIVNLWGPLYGENDKWDAIAEDTIKRVYKKVQPSQNDMRWEYIRRLSEVRDGYSDIRRQAKSLIREGYESDADTLIDDWNATVIDRIDELSEGLDPQFMGDLLPENINTLYRRYTFDPKDIQRLYDDIMRDSIQE